MQNNSNSAKEWLEYAQEDFDVAKELFQLTRYRKVIFSCEQALEKLLKTIYIEKFDKLPPRTHNIIHLSELVDIKLEKAEKKFVNQMILHYIGSRYPDMEEVITQVFTKEKAEECLKETEKLWKKFYQKLKLKKS